MTILQEGTGYRKQSTWGDLALGGKGLILAQGFRGASVRSGSCLSSVSEDDAGCHAGVCPRDGVSCGEPAGRQKSNARILPCKNRGFLTRARF